MKNTLLENAIELVSRFAEVLREDKALDDTYAAKKSEIEAKYNAKIAKLKTARKNRKSDAEAQNQSAQANIQAALDALAEAENKVPSKYKEELSSKPTPVEPNFQALNALAAKINDRSLVGGLKRLAGTDGYSPISDMANDYFARIEAGRAYLLREQGKSSGYLKQEENTADSVYAREKAEADRNRAALLAKNDQAYDQAVSALERKLMSVIDDPALARYDVALENSLERLGAFDDTWKSYNPSNSYPDQLMIGAITIPLSVPSPVDRMIQKKLPVAYSPGRGFHIPMTLDMSRPLHLLIHYDERCKATVMEGIQSILLKWIRFMPPYSFSITYIDPYDRGSNLGLLQKLEEITSWDICRKVYASREDIARRLKELERFVDATCSRLAGIDSAYVYNKSNEPVIVQQLLVINDFPENMDQTAAEALDVLINNASKCGISMIFTTKGSLSQLPPSVQRFFLKIDATARGSAISVAGKTYDFQFDTVCPTCEAFIESIKEVYNGGFKVDNRFRNYFSFNASGRYRESTNSLLIPFAVDSQKRLVELELGGALTAHALLSGATGSGKSTTLHMLITSIVLNYHPDDVELWLVDYNKVEFAEYIANRPPHVKLIGLERGAEFTFSLLMKINDECQRRMEVFKEAGVSDITEYKQKFGVRSLPRIILMIDEFHQMTQAIQNEPEYVLILENILSEYRKFGLSCFFSDQAIGDGLRGLTEKGKKQIRNRIAMANDRQEIRETLEIDGSFGDDSLMNAINRMAPGDVIFKRGVKDSTGETQIVIERYRAILTTKEERAASIAFAKKRLGAAYEKEDVLIVDGKSRKFYDEEAIEKFEAKHGGPKQTNIPIYVGTPASLDPCFYFSLQERLDSNIMVIGADTDMRASIALYAINCFIRIDDHEVFIFADERDELYREFKGEFESFASRRVHIVTATEEMCHYINGLLEEARNGNRPKTLILWLGIESIGADMSMYPDKPAARTAQKVAAPSTVDDLVDEIDSLLAGLDEPVGNRANEKNESEPEPAKASAYDARNDISELIAYGSRFGVHGFVTYSSVKMLRQSRFVKLECFEHKIALSMGRDDWSNYLDRVHYISDLDSISAVYYDGGSSTHIFRPYRVK